MTVRNDSLNRAYEPHPRVVRLVDVWNRMKPAPGLVPARRAMDPAHFPDLLPYVWMLDIHHEPLRACYRLVGEASVRIRGHSLRGKWIEPDDPIMGRVEKTVTTLVPSWRRGSTTMPVIRHLRGNVEVETLLLPIAEDGRRVDVVLGLTLYFDLKGQPLM
jgi:hypothetical protein